MRKSRHFVGPLLVVFVLLACCSVGRQANAFSPARPVETRTTCIQQVCLATTLNAKNTQNEEREEDNEPSASQQGEEQDDICETVKAAFANLHDTIRDTFKRLTELSLKDYQWRSSVFKSNEADRLMEQSLARMRGEDASYVRPMDAADEKIGPLVSNLLYVCVCVCS